MYFCRLVFSSLLHTFKKVSYRKVRFIFTQTVDELKLDFKVYKIQKMLFVLYVFYSYLSYYRQLSTETKIKNHNNNTSFVSPKKIRGKLSIDNTAVHDFSVWLRTGSNPADINRFRSHTENNIIFNNMILSMR